MQRRSSDDRGQAKPAVRFASWLCFLATLTFVLGLALVSTTQAQAPAGGTGAVTLFFEEGEEETVEGEEEVEACFFESGDEEADIEAELACEEAAEEAAEAETTQAAAGAAAACTLSDADATVVANPARGSVRLTIRYRARSAATVNVDYRLRGSRGGLGFGRDRARFSRSGVYRATARPGAARMKRVLAAKSFTVGLRAVNSPSYCHRHLDQRLTVRRGGGNSLTWLEPPARIGLR